MRIIKYIYIKNIQKILDEEWFIMFPMIDFIENNNESYAFIKDQINKFKNETFTDNYESKITMFHKELLKLSNNLGLGSDILVETVYEGQCAERVFTIKPKHEINRKDKHYFLDQIVKYMADFSKRTGMFDFYKDAYILINRKDVFYMNIEKYPQYKLYKFTNF